MKYTLPAEIDSLDDVDPNLHIAFVRDEASGKFRFLNPETKRPYLHGMKSALIETKTEADQRKAQLAQLEARMQAYEGLGDPETLRALASAREEIEREKKALPEQRDEWKRAFEAQVRGEREALQQQVSGLKKSIARKAVEDALQSEMLKAGVREDRMRALMKLASDDVHVEFDGSEAKVSVPQFNGKPFNEETVQPWTVGDVIASYKKQFPEMFRANAGTGGAAGAVDHVVPADENVMQWSTPQRIAYIKQHGQQAFLELVRRQATGQQRKRT